MMGDAVESLRTLVDDTNNHGTFDFGYIDANKVGYNTYYEGIIKLLKSGGFLMMDNTLWDGKVVDPEKRENDAETKAIHEVVQRALRDTRVETHSISISDGFTIVYKK